MHLQERVFKRRKMIRRGEEAARSAHAANLRERRIRSARARARAMRFRFLAGDRELEIAPRVFYYNGRDDSSIVRNVR